MSLSDSPERVEDLELPRYGAGALADLTTSVLASLGVAGESNVLGLPPTRHACVLLVDGMGEELLRKHRRHAPFLARLLEDDSEFTCGFPSTTATSLTSLGTGLAPGHHGILGYQVALPGRERLLNQLKWDADVDPRRWQPRRTAYERAEAAGVTAAYVASGTFEHTSLTVASARGSRYRAANDLSELVVRAAESMRAAERTYTFVYHSDLDSLGHLFGVDSGHWRAQLGYVDRLAEQIAAELPPEGALYITADHGMVDISENGRIDVENDAELTAGVQLLGGEPRARYLYTRDGAADDVLALWRERLAGRALVVPRSQAVEENWFGPVDDRFCERIGEVLAVALGDTALIAPRNEPTPSRLIGLHGSLTAEEIRIPLLRVFAES